MTSAVHPNLGLGRALYQWTEAADCFANVHGLCHSLLQSPVHLQDEPNMQVSMWRRCNTKTSCSLYGMLEVKKNSALCGDITSTTQMA